MPSIVAYALTSVLFTVSYSFTLLATVLPNWLLFSTPIPFQITTNYGLFKKCRGDCRVFPSSDENDCDEKNFCEEWEGAAAAMIFAVIIGGLVWLNLVNALVSGRGGRARAWKGITVLLMIHALFQFTAVFLIAHLYTTSNRFYIGTKYDISFIFTNISASFSVVLAIILFMNA
ncbi:7345_t:CDS:2 [Diversispora eburnea]|uniref:7345_t:CDS:1 n=1 Tax=Diversispora eburnea TaxID=1213867 RepID=A0A9N8YLW7_9GLOM|nr:7345_t:CDS:2 [Diversispora eburnea]